MTYIPGRPSPKQALTPPMTPRCRCYGIRHPLGASACPGAHLAASPARAEDHRTLPTCDVCQAATTAARRTAFSARLSRLNANEPLADQNGGYRIPSANLTVTVCSGMPGPRISMSADRAVTADVLASS